MGFLVSYSIVKEYTSFSGLHVSCNEGIFAEKSAAKIDDTSLASQITYT
jgi:hypothetical protein